MAAAAASASYRQLWHRHRLGFSRNNLRRQHREKMPPGFSVKKAHAAKASKPKRGGYRAISGGSEKKNLMTEMAAFRQSAYKARQS